VQNSEFPQPTTPPTSYGVIIQAMGIREINPPIENQRDRDEAGGLNLERRDGALPAAVAQHTVEVQRVQVPHVRKLESALNNPIQFKAWKPTKSFYFR